MAGNNMRVIPKDRGGPKSRTGHMLEHDRGTHLGLGEYDFPEVDLPTPKWPILSIVRRAHKTGRQTLGDLGWHDSLAELGRENNGIGQPILYGNMVLTLVSEADMETMLRKKVPHLYVGNDPQRLSNYMGGMIRDYEVEVGKRSSKVVARMNELLEERYHWQNGSSLKNIEVYKEGLFQEPTDPKSLAGLWGYLSLSVLPDLEGYDSSKLAIACDPNEHLVTELDETIIWLRSNGFDTNHLQPSLTERPLIPIFELRKGMLTAPVSSVPLPGVIDLHPPVMSLV